MRDDLLHAQASVDWAISNFPSLQHRMSAWIKDHLEIVVEETDANQTHNSLVVIQKADVPLFFNVEVGAYVNAIRSGLDLLATALAHRYGVRRADKAYFPIAESKAAFITGKYKGNEFIEGLPSREKAVFEHIEPYRGGNDLLVLLHDIDIERKHKRLLGTLVLPSKFGVRGQFPDGELIINRPGFPRVDNKTELGKLAKNTAQPEIELHAIIAFDETFFPKGSRIVTTLNDFAGMAKSIISLFDTA